MNKYGNYLGHYTFDRIDGWGDKTLTPQADDLMMFMKIVQKNNKDRAQMMSDLSTYFKDLIARDIPPENKDEEQELALFVGHNIISLMHHFLVAFKMTTWEQIEAQNKQQAQAYMAAVSEKE